MSSLSRSSAAAVLGILYLSFLAVQSVEIRGIRNVTVFQDTKIVTIDNHALKSKTLLFAACNKGNSSNCTVYLSSYPTSEKIYTKQCEVRPISRNEIMWETAQLKLFHLDQVIIAWKESNVTNVDNLLSLTLNMSNCKASEHNAIPTDATPVDFEDDELNDPFYGFYVVPYEESFDVFFKNKSLCGKYMCGQTHDKRGRIVNGPVASWLPSEFFKEQEMSVCPVKPGSSELGHFVISSNISLVSSRYGQVKHLLSTLTSYPFIRYISRAFSCNNGYLGLCHQLGILGDKFHCTQFNSQGERAMQFMLAKSVRDRFAHMAVSNLRNGGMLMLLPTSLKHDEYNAYKIQTVGGEIVIKHIHRFAEHRCYSKDINLEIHEEGNGDVCLSLACLSSYYHSSRSYLASKCVRSWGSALDSARVDDYARCDNSGCKLKVLHNYNFTRDDFDYSYQPGKNDSLFAVYL